MIMISFMQYSNFIIITGGKDNRKVFDKIYQLDTGTNSWLEVAGMTTPRVDHGLSVIKYSKVEGLCSEIGGPEDRTGCECNGYLHRGVGECKEQSSTLCN